MIGMVKWRFALRIHNETNSRLVCHIGQFQVHTRKTMLRAQKLVAQCTHILVYNFALSPNVLCLLNGKMLENANSDFWKEWNKKKTNRNMKLQETKIWALSSWGMLLPLLPPPRISSDGLAVRCVSCAHANTQPPNTLIDNMLCEKESKHKLQHSKIKWN